MMTLESAVSEWTEGGFYLRFAISDGDEVRVRVTDTDAASQLLAAVEPLRAWVAERDDAHAEWVGAGKPRPDEYLDNLRPLRLRRRDGLRS